jgi:hypothetical protein
MTPMNTDKCGDDGVASVGLATSSSSLLPHPCPSVSSVAKPVPALPIAVRVGTRADIPFIDGLQKKQSRAVGWMPTMSLEAKLDAGQVLVAEEVRSTEDGVRKEDGNAAIRTPHSPLPTPLGYLMGQDRYFKRDDVGVIYQMNIVPAYQRSLVAATLLKAQFERSAYGCTLYCCWCAQDLAANRFWEAMGFVPLAFRTGSPTKGAGGSPRVHIFWQKRIRAGDQATPWWFPSQTGGGAIREDRIVLPIPPGVHWSDPMPVMLPEQSDFYGPSAEVRRTGCGVRSEVKTQALPPPTRAPRSSLPTPHSVRRTSSGLSRPSFGAVAEKTKSQPRRGRSTTPSAKNDPTLVAAARELRDRWLEQMNNGTSKMSAAIGKYDVCRVIDASVQIEVARPAMTVEPTQRLLADALRSAA